MRHDAIYNTHSSVATINGDSQAWDKDGKVVELDESKIEAEVARLQAEFTAQAYSRNREAEYPSVQECVHAILDDTLDALQAKRAEIKTKYPKGG
jgi:3-mercaptopyruvate sulfurtransferase SseA